MYFGMVCSSPDSSGPARAAFGRLRLVVQVHVVYLGHSRGTHSAGETQHLLLSAAYADGASR